jgi:NAD(P)-dependent dehydrogenase (short-subunit alcohol dehydrogenase family)
MSRDRKVALITGGSRGIGLGVAQCLAGEGYALAINGVREPLAVESELAALEKKGNEAVYFRGDVSSPADRQAILEQIESRFGRLDVLVNNAGITSPARKDILEAGESSFDAVFSVNLKGPFFLTQAVAKWMIRQRGSRPDFSGCVVNISSISGVVASTHRGDYCMSKAAIAMASKLWAARLAEFGIPVYEVRPGLIESDMTAPVKARYDKLIGEGLTLEPRWGTPTDVGKAVATLVRGDLTYATGQVLTIDGGLTAQRL